MGNANILIGSVAAVVGIIVLSSAVFNWQWYYELPKARWIEARCGRPRARVIFALIGLLLIALGGAIAIGFIDQIKSRWLRIGTHASNAHEIAVRAQQ